MSTTGEAAPCDGSESVFGITHYDANGYEVAVSLYRCDCVYEWRAALVDE